MHLNGTQRESMPPHGCRAQGVCTCLLTAYSRMKSVCAEWAPRLSTPSNSAVVSTCMLGPEGSPLRPIKGHQRQSVQVLSDEGSPLRSEGPHQLPCSMLCSYVILEALACTCFHMLVLQSSHQRRGEHLHARAFVDCSPPVGSWPSSHQRRGEHLHAGRPSPPPVGSWLS